MQLTVPGIWHSALVKFCLYHSMSHKSSGFAWSGLTQTSQETGFLVRIKRLKSRVLVQKPGFCVSPIGITQTSEATMISPTSSLLAQQIS